MTTLVFEMGGFKTSQRVDLMEMRMQKGAAVSLVWWETVPEGQERGMGLWGSKSAGVVTD